MAGGAYEPVWFFDKAASGFLRWSEAVDRVVDLRLKIERHRRLTVEASTRAARLRPVVRMQLEAERSALAASMLAAARSANAAGQEIRGRYGMPWTPAERRRLGELRARHKPRAKPVSAATGKELTISGYTYQPLKFKQPASTATKFKGTRVSAPPAAPPPPRPGLEPGTWKIDEAIADRLMREWRAKHAPPEPWTAETVERRLVDAYDVLARLPMSHRPRGFGSASPEYLTEFTDLVGRFIDYEDREKPFRLRPSDDEVRAMEEALGWAALISHEPKLAKLVGLGAMWKARNALTAKRVRRLGFKSVTKFEDARKRGLAAIAERLASCRSAS